MQAASNLTPNSPELGAEAGIEHEIAALIRMLDGDANGVALDGETLAEVDLVRETAAEAEPRVRYKPAGPTLAKVAAAGIATLPAVLTPAPAFAGTPLPPNLMVAMAARPAAPPTRDVPPALAATGPQLFPFTRPMQIVRAQVSPPAPLSGQHHGAGGAQAAATAKSFSLNPRLRSIFSEQRNVAITTKRNIATSLYQVRKGDSLYAIAQELLGSGARWREIYEANQDKIGTGYLLVPGQRLAVAIQKPAKAPALAPALTAAAPSAKPYLVSPGDNLYTIAAKKLGDANRWREIVSLNKAMLNGKTLIYPNQWLNLPTSQV